MPALHVLIVEDRASDADLVLARLRRAAFDVQARIVETEADYLAALDSAPALILSDYRLPQFNGLRALELLKARGLDIPFILVSGTIGDELAAEAIKLGADDYVLKDRLSRLGTAVTQALERRRTKAEVAERGRQLSTLISNLPGFVYRCRNDADYTTEFVSESVVDVTGYPAEDFVKHGRHFGKMIHADDRQRVWTEIQTALPKNQPFELTYRITTATGAERWVSERGRGVCDAGGRLQALEGIVDDWTDRQQAQEALRESEAKYRGLIEQASDGILISGAQGNILLANSSWCELLGYTKDELVGMNMRETYLEEEKQTHADRLKQVAGGQTLRFERMVKRRDASTFPAEVSLRMLNDESVQGIFHDITARRAQEQKIVRLSRIHAVLSGINSAIVRIRDRQELFNEACRIAVEHGRFNIGWIAVLDQASGKLMAVAQAGLSVDFDAGGSVSDRSLGLVPAGTAEVALREKRPAYDNDIESTLGEISAEFGVDSMRVRRVAIGMGAKSVIVLPLFVERQTFGVVTLYAPERNFFDDAEVKLLTELAGDISFGLEFIAKEEKVDYLAYYDALSGLPNRSLFFDRLTHQLGSAARGGLNVALVIMDIDRFRLVNDTLGRQAGDALIGMVAQRIKDSFRDQDTVARVGANSFVVAVSGTWQAADAARVLKSHTHQLFGQPFLLGKEELRMSASAGVAVFPGDGDSPEALFANAEAALKKAKAGGERLLFYSPGMNARVADSLRLENKLRRAVDHGELVLWYQPKVSVLTREILGFEALMRWRDPESTLMVPPAQFIPLMEQTGLILEAGSWAMAQVARDCGIWGVSGMKLPRVAVNVSPIQLRQKDFVATVVEAAHKTQEAGSMLDLEITESVIMENVDTIIPKLQTIRDLGTQIAVDDFGTGYSSLAYIARLPIHDLKIDRSFVVGMTSSEDNLAIVRSVISLAHALRLKVVAEGVETEEQAALLLELGCNVMQGYLISRPLAPEQIPDLVRQQHLAIRNAPAKQVSSAMKKAAGTKPSVKRR